MRWLLFLSRVAFICNVFFILAVSIQLFNWIPNQDLSATIAIIGYFLVVLINPFVVLSYLLLWLIRNKFWKVVPSWLITANILFLVMELFYILYLNDSKHN